MYVYIWSVQVTTEYENVCSTSYVDKCSTVTEVSRETSASIWWPHTSCMYCPFQVTTKYENVCSTSYVESCATVTEVSLEWPGLWLVTTHLLIGQCLGDQGVSHRQPPLHPQLWSRWSRLWSLHSSGQEMCRGEEPDTLSKHMISNVVRSLSTTRCAPRSLSRYKCAI